MLHGVNFHILFEYNVKNNQSTDILHHRKFNTTAIQYTHEIFNLN